MVAVIGSRGEDRVEVDGRDAQLLQVVEMFCDAQKVAALEAMDSGCRVAWLQVQSCLGNAVALGKAIGEDLVKDGVLYPVGSVHGWRILV